jgi:hypothetical protein
MTSNMFSSFRREAKESEYVRAHYGRMWVQPELRLRTCGGERENPDFWGVRDTRLGIANT